QDQVAALERGQHRSRGNPERLDHKGAQHEDKQDDRKKTDPVLDPPGRARGLFIGLRAGLAQRRLVQAGRIVATGGDSGFGARRAARAQAQHIQAPDDAGDDQRDKQDQGEIPAHPVSSDSDDGMRCYLSSTCSTARKASCGISTLPTCFMRFLPAFCFSSSLRLREMSPPSHLARTFLRRALTFSRAITSAPMAAWMAMSNIWRGISPRMRVTTSRPRKRALARCTIMDKASTRSPLINRSTRTTSATRYSLNS